MKKLYRILSLTLIFSMSATFGAFAQVPFFWDFETGVMPTGWTQEPTGAAIPWSVGNSGVGTIVPFASEHYVKLYSEDYQPSVKLVTPWVDISELYRPVIEFLMASQGFSGSRRDVLKVYIRSTVGGPWALAGTLEQQTDIWEYRRIYIRNIIPSANNIQVAFEWNYSNGKGIALDDISIKTEPQCHLPNTTNTNRITHNSADLSWASNATSSFQVKVSTTPIPPELLDDAVADVANVLYTLNNPYELTGLAPNTTYYWYVKVICGADDISSWSPEVVFTTRCVPITPPLSENFTAYGTLSNPFPTCWTRNRNAVGAWMDENPFTNPALMPSIDDEAGNKVLKINAILGENRSTSALVASPMLDVTDMSAYQLKFRLKAASEQDVLRVCVAVDPDDVSTFQEIQKIRPATAGRWENIVIYLNGASNGGKYIVFYLNAIDVAEEGTVTFWIDDILTESMPDCPKPLYLEAASTTATTANLRWLGLSPSYNIRLYTNSNARPIDSNFAHEFLGVNMTNGVYETPSVLFPMTRYYGFVQANCGSGEWSDMGVFDTDIVTGTIPFYDGFEGLKAWILENDGTPNKWIIGSDVNCGGNRSLYVSNNNGNNTYTTTTATDIYAKRLITFEDGKTYEYSYDWRANGVGTTDYLEVYLQHESVATTTVNLSARLNQKTAWQTQQGTFSVPETGNYYFVAHWVNGSSGGNQPPAAIDNVSIAEYTCPKPTNIQITQGAGVATAAWTRGSNETSWSVVWGECGFNAESVTPEIVYSTSYTTPDLAQGTEYEIVVSAICADGSLSRAERKCFKTPFITSMPYITDFETPADNVRWEFSNDTPNGWVIGSGTNNGGISALYVSNNGTSNNYTLSGTPDPTSYSYAFRIFNITAGEYNLKFNWKGVGETAASNDACRVFLVPNNENTVVGGSSNGMTGSSISNHPASWKPLSDFLYNKSTWQTLNTSFNIDPGEAGMYKLVFFWRNNATGGSAPPSAIDNIEFEKVPCPQLLSINASNITATSARISWSSSEAATYDIKINPVDFDPTNDSFIPLYEFEGETNPYINVQGLLPSATYYVYIIAHCNNGFSNTYNAEPFIFSTMCEAIPVPYAESFSSYAVGAKPHCWQDFIRKSDPNIPNDASYEPRVISEGSGSNLNLALSFKTYYAVVSNVPRYTINHAILPEFTNNISDLKISFSIKSDAAGVGKQVQVGVMDDPLDDTTFEMVETYSLTTAWTDHTTFLDVYEGTGKFIAFKTNGGTALAIFTTIIDNINVVDIIQPCPMPDNFSTSNITPDSATISWDSPLPNVDFQVLVSTVDLGRDIHLLATLPQNRILIDTIVENATSVRVGGFDPATDYYYYVRTICGDGEYSYWYYTSQTFRTGCSSFSLPYMQGFNNNGSGNNPLTMAECWKTSKAGTGTLIPYLNAAQKYGDSGASLYMTSSTGANSTFAASPLLNVASFENTQVEFMMYVANSNIAAYYVIVGIMDDPTNPETFTPVDTVNVTAANTWQEKTVNLSSYTGTGKYVAFKSVEGRNTYIDDVIIQLIPTCPRPAAIAAGTVTSSYAVIYWTDPMGSMWDIAYGDPGFNPETEGTIVSGFTVNPDTLFGLNHNTTYEVYVRRNCGAGDVSTFRGPVTITTLVSANPLPIIENFENPATYDSWEIGTNPTGVNIWHIGDVVNNGGGSSAYISNNDGVANSYSDIDSYSYIYRLVEIPQTILDFSFDWRAIGKINTDLLRVFLIPNNVNIEDGNPYNMTGANNTTPSTWIDMGGGIKNLQPTWTTYSFSKSFTVAEAARGPYKLAFFWKNSGIGATNPPAAIDNINLSEQRCSSPGTPTATDITTTGADITWTGTASDYDVKVYTAGGDISLVQIADIYDNNQTATSLDLNGLLTPNTSYIIYVRGFCTECVSDVCYDHPSLWVSTEFKTPAVVADLPYSTDFENSANDKEWVISAYTGSTNIWAIGDAADNSSRCIYISDNGVTHNYNPAITSYSYAYKPFNFTAGEYDLSYDWRAYGEQNTDLLRVFLIPESVTNIAQGNPNAQTGSSNTIPNTWLDLGGGAIGVVSTTNNVIKQLNLSNSWQTNDVSFRINTDGVYNLAFFWKNNNTVGNQQPAAIDNVNVEKLLCSAPTNLTSPAKTTTTIDLSWTGTESNYNIKVFTIGSDNDLTQPGNVYNATENNATHQVTGLQPNTTYIIYVQANCGAVNGNSKYISIIVRTAMVPEPLPLVTNFESSIDNVKWAITGTGTNRFMIGNAVSYGGLYSLYVSNDNNANAYTITSTSTTYAYRMVNITSGTQYHLAFNWRANGQTTNDYMRVLLAPTTALNTLENGTNNTGITATAVPTGWIALDGATSTATKLNEKPNWQQFSRVYTAPSTVNGDYYLVIVWKNDATVGEQPPAAIDNFSFNEVVTNTHTDVSCLGYPYKTEIFDIPASKLPTPGTYNKDTTYFNPVTGMSIETLTLTVRNGGLHTETAEVCENIGYPFFGRIITTSGTYNHYSYADNGCDSITTLNLTVYPSYELFETQVINQDDLPVTIGDKTYDYGYPVGDSYVVINGQTDFGCDSIVKISIEITPCVECDSSGIDYAVLKNFVIAPNPISVGSRVQITADFTIEERNGLKVDVISAIGGTIKTFYPAATTYPIEVSGFDATGMYVIRVITGDGKIFFGKIIAK